MRTTDGWCVEAGRAEAQRSATPDHGRDGARGWNFLVFMGILMARMTSRLLHCVRAIRAHGDKCHQQWSRREASDQERRRLLQSAKNGSLLSNFREFRVVQGVVAARIALRNSIAKKKKYKYVRHMLTQLKGDATFSLFLLFSGDQMVTGDSE